MRGDNDDGKVNEAQAYLQSEVERLSKAAELAPIVLLAWSMIERLMATVSPVTAVVLLSAVLEHHRRDAHEWVESAVDYPDNAYRREAIRLGVDDMLDKIEGIGIVAADLLEDVKPATVRVEGDHIHIEDLDGEHLHTFEVVRNNAPGSEDLN